MSDSFSRATAVCFLICSLGSSLASGATLVKLSVAEMTQKSTLIVRGRISACAGEASASAVSTRCRVAVTEQWKGQPASELSFVIPGGSAGKLSQHVSGAPEFQEGSEYVLFLWSGRSGVNQVIGLSQGAFSLADAGTKATRAASSELMLDKSGQPIEDQSLALAVHDLHSQVREAMRVAVR